MSDSSMALDRAIAKLQLPHAPGQETDSGWISPVLASFGFNPSDAAVQLEVDMDKWEETGHPTKFIIAVVTAGLDAYAIDRYSLDGQTYFSLFAKITKGSKTWRGPSWWVTKLLLSKARVIGYLQCEEKYSASQIVRLLTVTDEALEVPFQAIQPITFAFDGNIVAPTIDAIDIVWAQDVDLGNALFADATLEESFEIAEQAITDFVPYSFAGSQLRRLSGSGDKDLNWPYFQMLYWSSLILNFYDHPAGGLYEFAPRGIAALHTFAKFDLPTGNPILNNAKATASLNSAWALNRDGDDAHALVGLIKLLESNPYSASVEIAKILRAWIVRTLALFKEDRFYLSVSDNLQGFKRLVDYICENETYTYGVIEQRVVDALSLLSYGQESGWQPSGLGDNVNATNTSRKKLGDVEFACVDRRRAVALEAHGGHLTKTYVKNHTKSLERTIRRRLDDSWAALADPEEWSIDLVFVAHSVADDVPVEEVSLAGVKVSVTYMNYYELRDKAFASTNTETQTAAFKKWTLDVLNTPRVRQSARDKAKDILSGFCELVPVSD